jgi:hypothetical protein
LAVEGALPLYSGAGVSSIKIKGGLYEVLL